MSVPSDIEIARAAKLKPIEAVAEQVGILTRRCSITVATSPSSTWAGSPSTRTVPMAALCW